MFLCFTEKDRKRKREEKERWAKLNLVFACRLKRRWLSIFKPSTVVLRFIAMGCRLGIVVVRWRCLGVADFMLKYVAEVLSG